MNDAVLEIEGLTVRSAEGDALVKNVGLCLKRQECLGIAGESGSGKTITAKANPPSTAAGSDSLCDTLLAGFGGGSAEPAGKGAAYSFWARKSVLYRRTRWLICIP